MQIYFKPKVTLVCAVLALLALRASWWQWERHTEKMSSITAMEGRLAKEITDFKEWKAKPQKNWSEAADYRRFRVAGEYDFTHEVVLRNRSHEGEKGVFVLTPMKLSGSEDHVLVMRGFLPLKYSGREERKQFQAKREANFIGLAKASVLPRFLVSPADAPTGLDLPHVDSFQRVHIEHINKQIPYPLLPIYFEVMGETEKDLVEKSIVRSVSGREEIFVPGQDMQSKVSLGGLRAGVEYPIPVFDTVIPPGRHFGYIFEWIIIAGIVVAIGFLLQLRP